LGSVQDILGVLLEAPEKPNQSSVLYLIHGLFSGVAPDFDAKERFPERRDKILF